MDVHVLVFKEIISEVFLLTEIAYYQQLTIYLLFMKEVFIMYHKIAEITPCLKYTLCLNAEFYSHLVFHTSSI